MPTKAQLKGNKSYAEASQGKAAKIRNARITAVRDWSRATRRALAVDLPLEVLMPRLPADDGLAAFSLDKVSAVVGGRALFEGLDLRVSRDRIAVTGPNGAGKTTLLDIMLQERDPTAGSAVARLARVGSITQGATDWITDDSLLERLAAISDAASPADQARLLVGNKFPLALAERPLGSLSPGERVRAALICLFRRSPPVEVLVLDEPTYSLDFVGLAALGAGLKAWPGGLVVVSHDREFLDSIGIEQELTLGGW